MTTVPQTLAGRHAVITGASRGIGAAIAVALAAQGARVSLLARDEAKLAELAEKLGGSTSATAISADVTDTKSVRAAVATACDRFGAPHILVNNAGQGPARGWRIPTTRCGIG